MSAPENPYEPPSDSGPKRPVKSLWLTIKRWIIGCFGVGSIAWAIFTTHIVLTRRTLDDGWPMLLATLVVLLLGVFATWIAIRGNTKDIKDFNLIP